MIRYKLQYRIFSANQIIEKSCKRECEKRPTTNQKGLADGDGAPLRIWTACGTYLAKVPALMKNQKTKQDGNQQNQNPRPNVRLEQ